MFRPPPLEWVEECRKTFTEMQASGAIEKDDRQRRCARPCFFEEEEVKHNPKQKKHEPLQGVSFF